ncbi:MAG: DUF11 domain-containing protein [Anaerolineaceae bacterium]|nr:DUF11 domain-containing protein [Anaerolineaceae bacterium]
MMKKWFLIFTLLVAVLWLVNGDDGRETAVAQTTSSAISLVENFSNGYSPPRFNTTDFNHDLLMTDFGWFLLPMSPGQPLSPTPQSALTLYGNNEDRITFNQPTPSAIIAEAQVWAWAWPAENGNPATSGRVVFEGTNDTKTFTFSGGMAQWQPFKVTDTDTGDNGRTLGSIVAIRLISLQADVMFDDLQVVSTTAPIRSNLSLTMSGPASPLTPGSTVTYDLTVTNNGPQAAPNVIIEDVLPYGGVFVPGGSTSGCTLSLGRVRCNLGTLSVGTSRTVTIAVQVGTAACASFTNRATVSADVYDNNTANNTAVHTATTSLPACADYAITLTARPVPVDPRDTLTYELTILNNGPDTAAATAAVTLPPGITWQQTYPDSGVSCSGSGTPLTCTIDALAAGQQKQVLIQSKTDPTLTGLQTTPAQVASAIPDPISANNNTRFRFAMGPPFDFTLIAELDTGILAGLPYAWSLDINEQGEVAFMALSEWVDNPADYGVFVGDGQTLTRRFDPADLPPLTDGLLYRSHACVDLSDAGVIALSHDIADPTISGGIFQAVGSILTRLDAAGSVTLLDTQTLAADGTAFRRYRQAVIDDAGNIVAQYDSPRYTEPDGLVRMINGQPVTIYQAATKDTIISSLGSATGGFAWRESDQSPNSQAYRLLWAQETPSGWYLRDVLNNNSLVPQTSNMMSAAPYGGIIYAQNARQQDGTILFAELYTGGRQPVLHTASSGFYSPVINDRYRYAFAAGGTDASGDDYYGIFVGPNPVAHRVVRDTTGPRLGDYLFGSEVVIASTGLICKLAINNAGQIAFAPGLGDGRTLIVRAEPTPDNDGDGITDWDELNAPNHGDGNNDGIPDSVQPEVASVSNAVDGRSVTFATDPNFTLTNVQAVPNPSSGNTPNDSFNYGFFSFELTDVPAGGSATVEVTLPGSMIRGWWKYGRTPNNPTPHWYNFTFDGTTGAEINGNVITLHFVDGQRGDDDLTANGVIVDPGGPSTWANSVYLPAILR